jgi:hypothetical protein
MERKAYAVGWQWTTFVCVSVCERERERRRPWPWPVTWMWGCMSHFNFWTLFFWFLPNVVWIYAISIALIRVLLNIRKVIMISLRKLALDKLRYSRGKKTIIRAKSKVESVLNIIPNSVYPGRLRSLRITLFRFYCIVIYLALYETTFLRISK